MDDQQNPSTRITFITSLRDDVEHALSASDAGSASDRRNLLRTIVSAIEGVSWVYRMHVLSIAKVVIEVSPLLELAFAESSFAVSEQGKIEEQPRYISTMAMIRLTTRVAKSINVDIDVDFSGSGWRNLRSAIGMRNRVTHPKSIEDLTVTDDDTRKAKQGFFWFLNTVVHVMEQTLEELSTYASFATELTDQLKQGDPATVALYNRVYKELND